MHQIHHVVTGPRRGETKFDGVAAEHGCYCVFIACHGATDGAGCYYCEGLAKKWV